MPLRVRSALVALLIAAASFLGMSALGASAAYAADTTLVGNLTAPDGTPVEGVAVSASNDDGFSVTATTDAAGDFAIPLPGGGTYQIEIDTATLPDGIALVKAEDASRSLLVLGGEKRILTKLVEGEGGGSGGGGFIDVTGDQFLQLLFDGILFGVMIALGALGLNMVFGTTGLTNFSHGDLLTLGAFTALLLNQAGLHIFIAGPLAIVIAAVLFGWGQNKVLWRPLRRRKTGLVAMMIISIGLAIVIRYGVALFFGNGPQNYKQFAGQPGISIGPVSTTPKALILAGLAVIALTATIIWVQRSRIGKATRAVSDNPALASATGIDVERVIAVVWIVAAGLAAFAGVYLGLTQDNIWNMGQRVLLIIFASVILGGLGTVYGAIVGALVVGVFIQMTTLVLPTEMKTVGALFVMIIILLIRPQGILGRRERVG
ncbi:MAG TPA: branched-chain amino acid ABC transporter permease [Candidatus Nanopelagicales bacterium]|nr:branched-chain amino acid ABC transporter permease [Candidatus Nanopelagicales bacterium]